MSLTKAFLLAAILVFFISFIFWAKFPNEKSPLIKSATPKEEVIIADGDDAEKTNPHVLVEKPTSPIIDRTKSVFTDVPFTVQAPFSEWSDPRFQDACEEASALMAMKWITGEIIPTKLDAKNSLLEIINWQTEKYGSYHDTSAADTADRIFKEYFNYENVDVKNNITSDDIITELQNGNLVIAPMNGQLLKNPFFTQPGPERHMVLILGFDSKTNEFITNDPGVSQGKNYHYPIDIFMEAIRDYPTGNHVPITEVLKNIIVIKKSQSR